MDIGKSLREHVKLSEMMDGKLRSILFEFIRRANFMIYKQGFELEMLST